MTPEPTANILSVPVTNIFSKTKRFAIKEGPLVSKASGNVPELLAYLAAIVNL